MWKVSKMLESDHTLKRAVTVITAVLLLLTIAFTGVGLLQLDAIRTGAYDPVRDDYKTPQESEEQIQFTKRLVTVTGLTAIGLFVALWALVNRQSTKV